MKRRYKFLIAIMMFVLLFLNNTAFALEWSKKNDTMYIRTYIKDKICNEKEIDDLVQVGFSENTFPHKDYDITGATVNEEFTIKFDLHQVRLD